jgi:hypothetical protein
MSGGDHAELKAFATAVTHGGFARAAEDFRIRHRRSARRSVSSKRGFACGCSTAPPRGLPLTGAATPRSGGS